MNKVSKKLSIVMPAYNEGALIYNNIMTTLETVSRFAENVEIVALKMRFLER